MIPVSPKAIVRLHLSLLLGVLLAAASTVHASTLSVGPSAGSFSVGSTFEVSLLLNTEGASVNALDISLLFPPDKLQVISPSIGKSLITVWTAPPSFDNSRGTVRLQGGIPGGVNVSQALVTTLTFRVRAPGTAVVQIVNSKVLLNDGQGTDSLSQTQNGVYTLTLPPPAGPVVSSETHPNQDLWHSNNDAILAWAADRRAGGYSYVLDREPVTVPDNIPEDETQGVSYRDLENGVHYFHIKALRGGVWGGTTHFAVRVDSEPPAEFPVVIEPSSRTSSRSPVIRFTTTDVHSGLSHTEIRVIPLSPGVSLATETAEAAKEPFFVEATSPYLLRDMPRGSYDVVVRSHDRAGNMRDVQERLRIVASLFSFAGRGGLYVKEAFIVPWGVAFPVGVILLGALAWAAWRAHRWYHVLLHRGKKDVTARVEEQLKELQSYRKKYGKLASVALLFSALLLGVPTGVWAQTVAPPQVTLFPKSISNEEIFYIGGSVQSPDTDVVIFLQNERSGEVLSVTVVPDEREEWFYRHHGFLQPGEYRVWTQGVLGGTQSPPSPQVTLTVESTAFQLGASRVSKETLYLLLLLVMSVLALALLVYALWHYREGRKQHRVIMHEVREAEESLRRGFAVLRRDMQEELRNIREGKTAHELRADLAGMEKELLSDLATIESRIGKEIWDIEEAERHP